MALTQDGRLLAVNTPLGKDALLLEVLEGTEEMSGLFRFNLVMLSERSSIAAADLIGKPVTIHLALAKGGSRCINGVVSRFAQGDYDHGLTHYFADVVPWLWFLTRTSDCRIFQKKTVPDIVQQIFKDLGFQDYRLQLQGSFEPREYCLQYRETDFNFVSRLLEEEGIFYFFEHTPGKHTLVLANSPSAHPPCPNQAQARYRYTFGSHQEEDFVTQWHLEQELHPGKYALADYYFPTPNNRLLVKASSTVKVGGNDKFEVYDYPGYFAERFDGEDKASKVQPDAERTVKLRQAAEDAAHKVVSGVGTCRAFLPGYRFNLVEHYQPAMNGPYVLTEVRHNASSNIRNDSAAGYGQTFTCIPYAVPFRPPRTTPKPVVQGCQTAVVVGLPGEEIDTDKYGRVKVQFHWDREGKKDANSSCWIRVATPWAGKQWGMVHIPRIGQEVVVHFLEGDPDQPIIIGSVYNGEQMPPYKLPDNKTQSGIKSRSTLKGGDANFNELRFEDKKGSEDVYFHAEKDFHRVVEHDDDLKVGNDQTIEVKNNRTETVKEGNEKVTIEKGDREVQIKMGNETLLIKMGNQTTKLDLGKSETEAMQSIELKVGQSSIKLDQTGVTIKGMLITIEGQVQTQLKGLMTQVNGSAMLQVQGGIIMLG
jgi:type VI secretion system secreted protein VgrG